MPKPRVKFRVRTLLFGKTSKKSIAGIHSAGYECINFSRSCLDTKDLDMCFFFLYIYVDGNMLI